MYWGLRISHAFAFCGGVQLLDASAEQISRKIEQFSPQDATWAIWSFARLFHYPDQAFLNVRSPRLFSILWFCIKVPTTSSC